MTTTMTTRSDPARRRKTYPLLALASSSVSDDVFMSTPVLVAPRDASLPARDEAAPSRLAVHFSSATPEHYTPSSVLAWVHQVFGDMPDLDPCSNEGVPNVHARRYYTATDDGLRQPWAGTVFVNPPYGRGIGEWIAKLRAEWARGHVRELIALLPNRPDTQWFHALTVDCAEAVFCSLHGRLTFVGNDASAPFPSLVVYFGPKPDVFASVFWRRGILWVRPPRAYFGQTVDDRGGDRKGQRGNPP